MSTQHITLTKLKLSSLVQHSIMCTIRQQKAKSYAHPTPKARCNLTPYPLTCRSNRDDRKINICFLSSPKLTEPLKVHPSLHRACMLSIP
ncbi:hypothetical protein HZ326_8901 [Fusarium oxysporum f. sp. albedinis]|nr:hypothetical protein HZ326_8901 [Fusarium oxysporum f. sp. albedinis]